MPQPRCASTRCTYRRPRRACTLCGRRRESHAPATLVLEMQQLARKRVASGGLRSVSICETEASKLHFLQIYKMHKVRKVYQPNTTCDPQRMHVQLLSKTHAALCARMKLGIDSCACETRHAPNESRRAYDGGRAHTHGIDAYAPRPLCFLAPAYA